MYSTTSRCLCHSESCASHAIKLAIILAAWYSLSSLLRLTRYCPRPVLLSLILVVSYSLPYSSRLTRSHTRRVLLATVHATGILIAILLIVVVLLASCSSHRTHRIVLIASCSSRRAHRVVLIASCSSRRAHRVVLIASGLSCRVVFANFPLFPTLRAMLCASKTAAMDVTLGACAGNAKCGSSIYRCTLDIKNRTGLSHYAWNPLRVCECDASICYDVPCLDSQRNYGAMTRVVRMPFALTRLHPEGKCPDTAASRRKMP